MEAVVAPNAALTCARDPLDASSIREMVATTTTTCQLLSAEEVMFVVACVEDLRYRTIQEDAKMTATEIATETATKNATENDTKNATENAAEGTAATMVCAVRMTSTCLLLVAITTDRATSGSVVGDKDHTMEATTLLTILEEACTTAVVAMKATDRAAVDIAIASQSRTLHSTAGSHAAAAVPTTDPEEAVAATTALAEEATAAAACADPEADNLATSVITTASETSKVATEVLVRPQVVAEVAAQPLTTTTVPAMSTLWMGNGACGAAETTLMECTVTAKVASTEVARLVTVATATVRQGTRDVSSVRTMMSAACRRRSLRASTCAGSVGAATCACVAVVVEALQWVEATSTEIAVVSAAAWEVARLWVPRLVATPSSSEYCVTQLRQHG